MHIDGLGMQNRLRIEPVDLAQHPTGLYVFDDDIGIRVAAEGNFVVGNLRGGVVPPAVYLLQLEVVVQHLKHYIRIWPELTRLPLRQGHLMCRTSQMSRHDEGIVRVDHRLLDGPLEYVLRMAHDVLIDAGIQADKENE